VATVDKISEKPFAVLAVNHKAVFTFLLAFQT